MSLAAAVVATVLALSQAPAVPPPVPPAPPEGNEVEEIVVQGNKRAVTDFVRQHAAPTKRGKLARWATAVCPGVVGLPQKQGAYIADRIAMEALALGLDVGEPGCTADIIILVTSRPQHAAEQLRERYRRFFNDRPKQGSLLTGGGSQKLAEFVNTPRPVRWWHVSELTTADGRPMSMVQLDPLDPTSTVPALESTGGSRLQSKTKEDLSRVLIIVDTNQVKGLSYEALASYLAMVSLAQLDPEAEPGGLPSILAMFKDRDGGGAPEETLTNWDRAYLKGLYASPPGARNLNAQKGAIRRELQKAGSR